MIALMIDGPEFAPEATCRNSFGHTNPCMVIWEGTNMHLDGASGSIFPVKGAITSGHNELEGVVPRCQAQFHNPYVSL